MLENIAKNQCSDPFGGKEVNKCRLARFLQHGIDSAPATTADLLYIHQQPQHECDGGDPGTPGHIGLTLAQHEEEQRQAHYQKQYTSQKKQHFYLYI